MAFSKTCSSIKLDTFNDNILTFKPIANDGSAKDLQKLDLNQVLGVSPNGQFVWGGRNFSKRTQSGSIKLENESTLCAKLQIGGLPGSNLYGLAYFNLDNHLENQDGDVVAIELPAAIAVKGDNGLATAATQLTATLKLNSKLQVGKAEKDGATFWRVGTGTVIDTSDIIFTTWSKEATAVFIKAVADSGRGIDLLNVEVLKAKAAFEIGYAHGFPVPVPTYVGVEANLNLFVAQASVFDVEFGISVVSAKVGLNQSSFEAELAGCGFVIGRRVGIAFAGAKVAVDLGRFF